MFFFKKHLLLYISNILDIAGSSLGFKLSEETRLKMSAAKKGLPSHRKGKTHTESSK
jgi:NUMOD3 motif